MGSWVSVCCHHAPYLRKSHHYGCTVISVAISTKSQQVFKAILWGVSSLYERQLVTDNPQLKSLFVSFCVSIRYSFRFQHKNLHHERTISIVQSVFSGSYYMSNIERLHSPFFWFPLYWGPSFWSQIQRRELKTLDQLTTAGWKMDHEGG